MSDDRFYDVHGDISDAEAERQSLEEEFYKQVQTEVLRKVWAEAWKIEGKFKDLPSRVLFRECIAEIVDNIGEEDG